MKAVVFRKYGSPDVLHLEEVEKPTPKDSEVLIKIDAATVATADCEARGFIFPRWLWLPMRIMFGVFKPRIKILGQELAGEIEAVGKDVIGFNKGDQVFAPINCFGAHAEYICLPADGAIATKPANLSYEEAACVTVFGLNALHFIRIAEIESGKKSSDQWRRWQYRNDCGPACQKLWHRGDGRRQRRQVGNASLDWSRSRY